MGQHVGRHAGIDDRRAVRAAVGEAEQRIGVLDGLLDDYSDTAISYMVDYLAHNNPAELRRLQREISRRLNT